jgi:hypothetical protein
MADFGFMRVQLKTNAFEPLLDSSFGSMDVNFSRGKYDEVIGIEDCSDGVSLCW